MRDEIKFAYEELANGIVELAAKDYAAALRHLKNDPSSENARGEVVRLERFFYSDWYEMLTDLDAEYLIREIKKMVG